MTNQNPVKLRRLRAVASSALRAAHDLSGGRRLAVFLGAYGVWFGSLLAAKPEVGVRAMGMAPSPDTEFMTQLFGLRIVPIAAGLVADAFDKKAGRAPLELLATSEVANLALLHHAYRNGRIGKRSLGVGVASAIPVAVMAATAAARWSRGNDLGGH